jgi:hypothetical protein
MHGRPRVKPLAMHPAKASGMLDKEPKRLKRHCERFNYQEPILV